jgi:DNA-binding NarL/FixJ family response regulator
LEKSRGETLQLRIGRGGAHNEIRDYSSAEMSLESDARIIVLTTYHGDVQVLRALQAGARAYLLKGHDRELIETIHAVYEGRKKIPPEIAAELAEHATDEALSEREN